MATVIRNMFWAFLLVLVLRCSITTLSETAREGRPVGAICGASGGPAAMGRSPIDLSNERVEVVSYLGRLNWSYRPSDAILKNRGHDIRWKWEQGAGHIRVNRMRYVLRQCHWHSPSEHTVNGQRFDLEFHMVHEGPNGEAAVVGVMYKLGRPDSFLSSITSRIAAIVCVGEVERAIGMVNPKAIKIGSRKYYRYLGSLTVPPRTQNVLWTIVQKVKTVSQEQAKLLHTAVRHYAEFNSRPLQPINGGPVRLFRPSDSE